MKLLQFFFVLTSFLIISNNLYAMRTEAKNVYNPSAFKDTLKQKLSNDLGETQESDSRSSTPIPGLEPDDNFNSTITCDRNSSAFSVIETSTNLTPDTNKQVDSHTQSIAVENKKTLSSGSTFLKKAWFGAASHFGLSRTTTFFQLHQNGTLKADLISENLQQSQEPVRRLLDATAERFTDEPQKPRPLSNPGNQEKIAHILAITETLQQETTKKFELPQDRAEVYNPLQEAALAAIYKQHATIDQPRFKLERDALIKNAWDNYKTQMRSLRDIEANAASNTRYINKHAQATKQSDLQDARLSLKLKNQEKILRKLRKDIQWQESKPINIQESKTSNIPESKTISITKEKKRRK